MNKITEELKATNHKAYLAFMSLRKDNIELQEENIERGTRISKLQKCQTQPKWCTKNPTRAIDTANVGFLYLLNKCGS